MLYYGVLTCAINLKIISVKMSITSDIAFVDFNDIILRVY